MKALVTCSILSVELLFTLKQVKDMLCGEESKALSKELQSTEEVKDKVMESESMVEDKVNKNAMLEKQAKPMMMDQPQQLLSVLKMGSVKLLE